MEREGSEMSHLFKARCLWVLLAFSFPFGVSAAPQEVSAASGGFSSHWTPQEWTCTGHYPDIKNYADRPDEQTLKGLSVEWQKPEMDALGNICTIRGQVRMTDGQK